ncbi:MAG TPA: PKD domain-containing protein [Methanocorpusculum sp.]|nr:PKD domain-containing protein [Methanocorpusculum sp.]
MNWKKGMKWIVAVFAVLVLMSVFVGVVSADDNETTPATPTAPTNLKLTADPESITAGGSVTFTFSADGATKYSLDYGDGKSDDSVSSPKTHQYDKAGTYTAKLTAYNGSVSETETTSIKVTEKEDEVIPLVDVTLTAPETGKTASNPTSSANTKATVTWDPVLTNGKFSGGQDYTATVTVTADTGYVFSDSVTAKLNGGIVTPTLSENKKSFTVTNTFPETATPQQETQTPEISGFSADKTSGTAPLTVSFTFTAKNATSFELKSGDTTLKTGMSSPMSYTFTEAGNYSIKLVAKNGDKSAESTNTISIKVSPAQTLTTLSTVNLEIAAPEAGKTPATSVTGTGIISQSVEWSPSDSPFKGSTEYTVTIIVENASGYVFPSSKPTVKVNGKTVDAGKVSLSGNELTIEHKFSATGNTDKPGVTLTAEPTNPVIKSGQNSATVQFTYKITGDYDNASIDFGDGAESPISTSKSSGTISHPYASEKTYKVTLKAANANGVAATDPLSISVTKEIFKASFDASLLSGEAPLKVLFTDTSTGTTGKIIQRSWDFDDGTTVTSQTSVTHTFEKEGTYYVQLFISDGINQDSERKTITVTKKGSDTESPAADIEYEPFILIGDVGIPSPFDLIAEFIRLFQEMLNFDNYTIFNFNNETESP